MATLATDIHSEIRSNDDTFERLFDAGDAPGLAELYTQGGMLLPPGSESVTGREAIAGFWKGAMDAGIRNAKLDIVEVEAHGDAAVEVGRFTLKGADGSVLDRGKYVVEWHREDGRWKVHRDIWNSSGPVA